MRGLRNISGYWWCQLIGWGVVAFSALFYAWYYQQEIAPPLLIRTGMVMAAGIVSTHLLRWVIHRLQWTLLPVEKLLWRIIPGVLGASLLMSLLVMMADAAVTGEAFPGSEFLSRLLANTLNFGIYVVAWTLLYYFIHYVEKGRRQEVDTLRLEAMVKELELKTIKSHINPHFLFNALNSIRALIDEQPARARNAVTHLGNILRSSMQAENLETVPFEKELGIVKDYLALEQLRFEDRLRIEYHVDEQTLSLPVPPMMVQTLVENAIKHGIGRQIRGGTVRLVSDLDEGYHRLVVGNTGRLGKLREPGGFGLTGTRGRLFLLFGEKAQFDIGQQGDEVVACIRIPYTKHYHDQSSYH